MYKRRSQTQRRKRAAERRSKERKRERAVVEHDLRLEAWRERQLVTDEMVAKLGLSAHTDDVDAELDRRRLRRLLGGAER